MNTMKWVAALAIACAAPAAAQEVQQLTPEFRACVAGTASQAETSDCMSQEVVRQDALVGAELRLAKSVARPEIAKRLDAVQAAWAAFREKDCQTKAAAVTGTGATSQYLECMLHHSALRKLQLSNYWSL
ncbi:DUF1311 domain-containing protein [Stenotrophomonas maltophilia]|nr:DUF1311 domain-containing protein [Stenotrophomonas maltophilia]